MKSILVWVALMPLFYISATGWIWQGPVERKNNEGIKLYREGKFDDALSKWRDAQIDSPDKKELHYNIGNALHGRKKYKDAFSEYEKSLDSKNASLHAKTYYNMGNTFYRMGRLPEAIDYYKKALDINPDDKDAKYNIEFIRKKIKENLKKESSQQPRAHGQKQKQPSGAQDENAKGRKQEPEKSPQASEEKKASEKKKGKGGEKKKMGAAEKKAGQSGKKEEGKQKGKEGEMSKEDAVRLLDALKNDEKELQKQLRAQPSDTRYRVDKDW